MYKIIGNAIYKTEEVDGENVDVLQCICINISVAIEIASTLNVFEKTFNNKQP